MAYLLRTLGPSGIESGAGPADLPPGKPFALLVYLAVEARAVRRDDLARLLWPGVPRERGLQSVRQAVWLLRRTLGDAVIGADALVTDTAVVDVDVAQFRSSLAEGRLDDADGLWRGAFLERFAVPGTPGWDEWVDSVRAAVSHEFATALRREARVRADASDPAAALRRIDRAVEVEPHEPEHRAALIELLLDLSELDRAAMALAEARRTRFSAERMAQYDDLERRLDEARRQRTAEREIGLLRPEFVGRATELADLLRLWRSAKGGRTLTAVVSGQVGIGKTRLAEEMCAAARRDGACVVALHAAEAERTLEWGIVALFARKLLQQPGSMGITAASDATLRGLLPSLAAADGRIGEEQTGRVQPAAYADALIDLIGAVSYEAPLLVLIDDVQWLDPSSRALLIRVLRQARDEPVLFLLTCRSEDLPVDVQRSIEFLEREETTQAVRLHPLGISELSEMLGLMVEYSDPAAAGRIVQRIHAVTGGNPLFIVELMQALADEDVVVFRDDTWRLLVEKMPESFRLPDSLHAAITRRLERLSEDAGLVASVLVQLAPRASVNDLKRATRLDEGPFVRAVGELIDRDILRWREDRVEFTHDRVRETVRQRYEGMSLGRRFGRAARHRWVVITAALTVVAIFTAWMLRDSIVPGMPLYGGGELHVRHGATAFVLEPPRGRRGEWTRRAPRVQLPELPRIAGPYLTTTGDRHWFVTRAEPQIPTWLVEWNADGEERVIAQDRVPIEFATFSPDGEYIAWTTDDRTTAAANEGLVIARADGSEPRVVFTGRGRIAVADWTADGQYIGLWTSAASDSAFVITPDGRIIASTTVPNLRSLAWCGGSTMLAMVHGSDGPMRLSLWHFEQGILDPLPAIEPATEALACSPDGSLLATQVVQENRLVTVQYDIETATTSPLPVGQDMPAVRLRWIPSHIAPVIRSVEIVVIPDSMRLGERVSARAVVRRSDGSVDDDAVVRWESLDGQVVSATPDGALTGNRPGTTRIVAIAGGWRADTTEIEVMSDGITEGLLLRDPFVTFDTTRWRMLGTPSPTIGVVDGSPALRLRGDGAWADGFLSRETWDLARGATLEIDFQIPLTPSDRQSITLFLGNGEPLNGRAGSAFEDWIWHDKAEITFPASEQTRIDSAHVRLDVNGLTGLLVLPEEFDASRWSHAAIQLRADGEVRVFMDHTLIGVARVRVNTAAGARWRIGLLGSAIDTRLLARNLVLWDYPRY